MKRFLFLAVFILFPLSASLASDFSVVPEKSSVRFTSEAPMETVRGETQKISGTVSVNPPSMAAAKASFSVDAGSLKTGNRLRDKNMRNNFLHTAQFPEIVFRLTGMGGTLATGKFTLHGVTKEIKIPVTALWNDKNNTLQVKSKFSILLSDYGIERPRILLLRLSDTVEVDLDIHLQEL
ncbi:MAG: YceI family protein [Deltaproteobacteria bacterium]|nr:YceI family protein [Deltaproteobacteria bacterium]